MERINIKNIALLSGSILLCLTILEICTRIFYGIPPNEISDFSLSKSDYYQKDKELMFVPRKNIKGNHDKQGSFSTTFQTNSRGLRDKEYALKKPDGIKRIVVVGDSFTWGFGVNDSDIYTERMESLLPDTEVINLGVTAYQLPQEIHYFKREGGVYDPDILIVTLCLNDFIHGKVKAEDEKSSSDIGDIGPSESKSQASAAQPFSLKIKHRLKEYLFQNSAFLTFILDRVNTSRPIIKALTYTGLKKLTGFEDLDWNLMPALKDYPDYLIKGWEEIKSELLQFKRLASDSGVRLIVVVVPSVQSIQEVSFRQTISHSVFDEMDFDLDKPYRMLKEFASANNIEMIIPVNTFRDVSKKGRALYLTRDMHFNADGHDLFARVIADYLLEIKW